MTIWTDSLGQVRCDEIEDLTFEQLKCAARRIHVMDSGMRQVPAGTTFPNAIAIKTTCECSRWRRRTLHATTHRLLTVAYGGGVILTGEFNSWDVWYAYMEAQMQRQRSALVGASEL